MKIGIYNLESAIEWIIDSQSNGEYFATSEDIVKNIEMNYFPILKYLYSNQSIEDLNNSNFFDKKEIIQKINSNTYRINEIPNRILVETRLNEKKASLFEKLQKELKKDRIKLEKIIDIEFFEYYEIHQKYLESLNGKDEEKLLKFSDDKRSLKDKELNISFKWPSQREMIRNFNKCDCSNFEYTFFQEDPVKLIEVLNNNNDGINKKEFSTFMDTEKIHIQMAICSKGNQKNIPVLAYFGFGNYYPFAASIKNKDNRFKRFSQINNSDNIDSKYYLKEIQKSQLEKEIYLKELINSSQLEYHSYFEKNFNLKKRKDIFEKKYNSKTEFSLFTDDLLMLDPIFRTKSAALIAYDYKFY